MRPRYSFSSRRTKRLDKIRKQRQKYPAITDKIIQVSDIVLEILDARFPEDTRNLNLEKEIKKLNKKIIFVLNKSDLVEKKYKGKLFPVVAVSSKNRKGIKDLRDLIKREAKTIEKKNSKIIKGQKVIESSDDKITVGVVGYPNTGKSSLINVLVGKTVAGTGSQAGFTKGFQKLKLTTGIVLIDSPGVIPEKEYSMTEKDKITQHTKVGGRSYSQVKEPELVVDKLVKEYGNLLEKFYKISAKENSEILIEKLGKKKGFLKKGGEVNEDQTARFILKDWQSGNIKI